MTREEKEKFIRHLRYNLEIGADYLITDEDVVEIIKALEQEPCEDCVSRQAVLEYIEGSEAELGHSTENELVCQYIKELPLVTPQPKIGHWVLGICDNCGYDWGKDAPIASVTNFCPNCGCAMFKMQESEG